MKVLFAVNSEKISNSIVSTYQKTYKDVLAYKNVYYFNALIKEITKDKTYDRIVISEDLEPFSNDNYDSLDKFLFEKLDAIGDEANNISGQEIPIVLICTDRRAKGNSILNKIFGIGIYNALIGEDRSIEQVCGLLYKPRGKKEAKLYYKIEVEDVKYKTEDENTVSEQEIQNIRAHYSRLGKNEEKYIESFENIVSQYNVEQLKIIVKFLSLDVRNVLEQRSESYQKAILGKVKNVSKDMYKKEEVITSVETEERTGIDALDNMGKKKRMDSPVVISRGVAPNSVRRLGVTAEKKEIEIEDFEEEVLNNEIIEEMPITLPMDIEPMELPVEEETVMRGRGRPKKTAVPEIAIREKNLNEDGVKRGRGRPKKILEFDNGLTPREAVIEPLNIESIKSVEPVEEFNPFELDEEVPVVAPVLPTAEPVLQEPVLPMPEPEPEPEYVAYTTSDIDLKSILSPNQRISTFVGTTKNGTSFLVNNLATYFSNMGIKTAVLDLTQSRNAFYIYTKNEEALRKIAYESIEKLRRGINAGIVVNNNLSVFTALPTEKKEIHDIERILITLAQNYQLILIDADFKTPTEYFSYSTEMYLVQNLDILTIQPFTQFLKELKNKNVLDPAKLRIVVNKYVRTKVITPDIIIGGLAFYNDPAMTYMNELFDRTKTMYTMIPFAEQNYAKYLEGLVNCEVSIEGYSKDFLKALKELSELVYPAYLNKKDNYKNNNKKQKVEKVDNRFSPNVSNTLEQMKNNY